MARTNGVSVSRGRTPEALHQSEGQIFDIVDQMQRNLPSFCAYFYFKDFIGSFSFLLEVYREKSISLGHKPCSCPGSKAGICGMGVVMAPSGTRQKVGWKLRCRA
jgi:hypothetical protein